MKIKITAACFSTCSALAIAASALATATAYSPACNAAEIDLGNPDWQMRWDNTLRYGVISRLRSHRTALVANPNQDDGNRNFDPGIVSNRVDWVSEIDVSHSSGLGARVSGAAWYDDVYNRKNDNPGFAAGAFPNHTPHNRFSSDTQLWMGRNAEFLDAFVYQKFDLADMPSVVRLGQHALVWGESLFFSSNAIAGAQSPYDLSRLATDSTAQAKEYVLPVPQVSGQIQLTPDVSIGAYYQFEFVENRLPAAGSYFAVGDTAPIGGESILVPLPSGQMLKVNRNKDVRASDSGQGGVQLKWNWNETDFGFYALRFHSKSPVSTTTLGTGGVPASYTLVYPEDTTALAFSASHSFGDTNLALEAGVHHNQPLYSTRAVDFAGSNNSDKPAYAVGRTGHLNLSAISNLPPTAWWNEASLTGEIAWNRMLSCTKQCGALDANTTRDASALSLVFQPTYRQVLPGLDIDVPIGVQYAPKGSRSSLAAGFPPENGGTFTLGVAGTYDTVWKLKLAYTNYFGKAMPATITLPSGVSAASFGQSLADRDYISFSVRRTW
ncbi:DUF1302 domain-containing protein [Pseudomonas sp. B11]